MKKVYVRISTSEQVSIESQVIGVFTSKQDAEDCAWGDDVIAIPLHEGPAEFKEHLTYIWHMNHEKPQLVFSAKRIYAGDPEPVHVWARENDFDATLIVTGWDEEGVLARLDSLRDEWQRRRAA